MCETKIPPRQAFGEELLEQGRLNDKLVVVSCDLCGATKTKAFGKEYPDRFFEVGIAEQNGISIAAGLAMEGYRPFISSFGAFLTARYDQIRISCAYSDAPVVLVGTHSGLAIGKDGATQMGIEDVNIMSGIPGMKIYQPADYVETRQIVEYLANNDELAYLRLSRMPQPRAVYPGYKFVPNVARDMLVPKFGGISVITSGDTVYHSLIAAHKLKTERNFPVGVINLSTLKPLDKDKILDAAVRSNAILTVEDHSIIGGLGSRVCEVIAEAGLGTKVRRLGINDCFGESGAPEDLYRKHGLDQEGIYDALIELYDFVK